MAFEDINAVGGSIGSLGDGISSLSSALFGDSETVSGKSTKTVRGTTTKQLEIDQAGVEKILADILGSEQGLAAIFSNENTAGLYGSTVASQASGDLVTKLAGEIAKLQAREVSTEEGTVTSDSSQTTSSGGLFDSLGF